MSSPCLCPERTVLLSHPEHLHEVLVRQHRTFQKGRRGDVSKQWLGEGLLNSGGARNHRAGAELDLVSAGTAP